MEAVVLDKSGKSNFHAMQLALGAGGNRSLIQAYVFDLLFLDGKDWTPEPLVARKRELQRLLGKSTGSKSLYFSADVVGQGSEVLAKACKMGLEGIVSKLAHSSYQFGRQQAWLKTKCILRQEFIIVGYTAARSGPRAIGALHLGYNEDGELKYAGKVGTGFTMKDAQHWYARLSKMTIEKPVVNGLPRSVITNSKWVRPELVGEVSFTEWTPDRIIRHPSFHGLRQDKKPKNIVKETPTN